MTMIAPRPSRTAPKPTPSPARRSPLHSAFRGGRGYLAACTGGIPPRHAERAIIDDVRRAARGDVDGMRYSAIAERAREHAARLVGVASDRVAIGSQVSVFMGLVASAVPDGAEVLCVAGDFSSVVMPFRAHEHRGVRLVAVPASEIAQHIGPNTAMVVFSLVQSATGEVLDLDAIQRAAARHGARTVCDATQAVGWMPVDASRVDALLCHAYKWLCAPRGVAFAAFSERLASAMRPLYAGWYAGEDPWASCYGSEIELAESARRFDVSPAWQAFVGAEPALELFADADAADVFDDTTTLARSFRARIGVPEPVLASAIVTWRDPEGTDLAKLSAAGIHASGRAGNARVAFHVFNDEHDVELAVAALCR